MGGTALKTLVADVYYHDNGFVQHVDAGSHRDGDPPAFTIWRAAILRRWFLAFDDCRLVCIQVGRLPLAAVAA